MSDTRYLYLILGLTAALVIILALRSGDDVDFSGALTLEVIDLTQ